jgi:GTP-binding protein EngB required for normal cell division
MRGATVDGALSEELRREALRALWRGPNGDVDLPAAIDAVARFASEHDLAEVERSAAALRDELDRPLVLAVLGEFNAGKSTFINAFVGADVAPTGILPTTATLNLLRGGAERRVRVVRGDGTTREGTFEDLHALLKEAQSTSVDRVEIVLPAETLERVWILDTPGTNAIDPHHEQLAREAARRADAALWVFDAGQAGKGTEGKILAALVGSRRTVVPVLNKIDRLRPGQLDEVRAVLATELPRAGLDAVVSAISARQALRARLDGDDGAYAASGFGDLVARLEKEIFSRSRELKRAACAGRLLETLGRALATEDRAVRDHDERIGRLEDAASPLADVLPRLFDSVDEAVAHLERELDRAFDEAASEVLSFVRPRKSRFERHGADREDRAFLADVLERRLAAAVEASGARLSAKARGLLAAAAGGLPVGAETLDARLRAAVAGPLSAHAGYQRGLLAGGALRRFFEEALPRAVLEQDALAEALRPAGADPRLELRGALGDALADLVAGLDRDRLEAVEASRRAREGLRAGVYEPLRALRSVLAELI